jgi:hypothetical protein
VTTNPTGGRPGAAPTTWYRRLALEARNVALTTVAGFVLLALIVGAVILITAIVSG